MISCIRTLKFVHLKLHRWHTVYALSDGRPLWNKLSVTAPVGIRVVSDRFYSSKFCHNLFWKKNTFRTLFFDIYYLRPSKTRLSVRNKLFLYRW